MPECAIRHIHACSVLLMVGIGRCWRTTGGGHRLPEPADAAIWRSEHTPAELEDSPYAYILHVCMHCTVRSTEHRVYKTQEGCQPCVNNQGPPPSINHSVNSIVITSNKYIPTDLPNLPEFLYTKRHNQSDNDHPTHDCIAPRDSERVQRRLWRRHFGS